MKLSDDPIKRARSLANLQKGRDKPARGVGAGPKMPPFEKGNQLTRTHGGQSRQDPGLVEARTREIVAVLSAVAPARDANGGLPVEDAGVVRLLADTLCRLDSVSAWLSEQGLFDGGDVRPAVDIERRLRSQALDLSRELGLTPSSRAKLGLDLARTRSAAEQLNDHLKQTYDADPIISAS
jgi:hypothetical protein